MEKTNKVLNGNKFFVIMLSIAIALIFAIGITFAWLTDIVEKGGDAIIGEVGIEFYTNGGTKKLNTVKYTGKNKFVTGNLQNVFSTSLNSYITIINNNSFSTTKNLNGEVQTYGFVFDLIPNTTYTLSAKTTTEILLQDSVLNTMEVYFYDITNGVINFDNWNNDYFDKKNLSISGTNQEATFTTPANSTKIAVVFNNKISQGSDNPNDDHKKIRVIYSYVQLEQGSSATAFEEYKSQDGIFYEVKLGSLNTAVPIDLTIKNTGTIPGIVKSLITISLDDGPHNHYTDIGDAKYVLQTNQADISQTNWVTYHEYEHLQDVYYFNSFLNEQLPAGASKSVINSITPRASGLENSTLYIRLVVSIVAYSGNAYQVDTPTNPVADKDKPFGVLPSNFLNNVWTAWK